MASILIAWELGSGLGHVGPLRAIGGELAHRGHRATIAAPNVELCRQAFAGTTVETIVAPALPISEKRLKLPCTYSDLLHDCGFSSAEAVTRGIQGWLDLFERFAPDLLMADHSPTALLANRLRRTPSAVVGTGFVCPPDISPLPSLRHEVTEPHWGASVEQTVLDSMNAALDTVGGPALTRVTEVFGTADRQYLITYPELDHYRHWRQADPRPTEYWQPVGAIPGQACPWPTGEGIAPTPRVFVYLRQSDVVVPILRGLAYKRISTICYAPHLGEDDLASLRGTSVSVSTTPLDLPHVLERCTAAVLHGGHGTVCEALRAGVPMLLLPQMLEQRITAETLEERCAAVVADMNNIADVAAALERLLEDSSLASAARKVGQGLFVDPEGVAIRRLIDDIVQFIAC